MKLTGHTALVTGASAGIGKAFALEAAARGADLVLTARRRDKLDEVAAAITERYERKVTVLPADLAERDAPEQLFREITERRLSVDILINNAGYAVPGTFKTHAWDEHAAFLQVMVTSVAHLTHLCLPAMVASGYGRIVNVASLAGLLPGAPTHTLYGAAKAFVIKFSESLSVEVAGRGVNVTAVCPGFTWSEFHDVNSTRAHLARLPRWLFMDAATVARQGLSAVARGETIYVNGLGNRALAALSKSWPDGSTSRVMRRTAGRFLDQWDQSFRTKVR